MCGIVGVLSFDSNVRVDWHQLIRMRDTLAHRGPDDAGIWAEGAVALGHRRLSIVDVAGGHQPMANEDASVWVVFNGEIYNHAELRRELQAKGHVYRTRSDTETILHLYEDAGDRAVERLRGMFAFAIWDRSRRRLLLARDRLGIKPLYYTLEPNRLVFASEIKALLAAGVTAALDRAVLPELLATRYVAGERTLFEGVRRLLPGHTLSWSAPDGFQSRQYWQIPLTSLTAQADGFDDEARRLRTKLEAAVERHLMSDVPLGVFLSGGLDSSALAGLTAKVVKEPLRTFAVGFADRDANELPYARLVAHHIGARHHEVIVTPQQYFDALPQIVWQEDEPPAFTSSVPLYFVSKLARDHVKVVLTGEGSDELFLGYHRYRIASWNHRCGAPYWALTSPAVRRCVRRAIDRLPRRVRRFGTHSFLAVEPGPRSLVFENYALFSPALRRALCEQEPADAPDPYAQALESYAAGRGDVLDRMSRADLETYLQELLMKQDQMSMAASIESRVPFLDDDIIEYAAALPARFKLRGWRTKAILRAAVADVVPEAVLTRRKMGFPVPVGRWLRNAFQSVVDEFLLSPRSRHRRLFDPFALRRLVAEHQSGAADHGDRLWMLINLEIWQRIFCDGEEPARVMTGERHAPAASEQEPPAATELTRASR